MIQYVLTYYPNVGASKRETANGGTQPRSPANPRPAGGARGPRPGAGAMRRGRGRNLARGSSRILILESDGEKQIKLDKRLTKTLRLRERPKRPEGEARTWARNPLAPEPKQRSASWSSLKGAPDIESRRPMIAARPNRARPLTAAVWGEARSSRPRFEPRHLPSGQGRTGTVAAAHSLAAALHC